ncbi:hypothetical protein BZA70DRAFT_278772 [Myxozyma melibiosi]|uniref:FAS1 domain-containing protein n=1 Tax=Myxozyma melibiosi TaxID=54550 RepID=A0ABR1F557_9ASCO
MKFSTLFTVSAITAAASAQLLVGNLRSDVYLPQANDPDALKPFYKSSALEAKAQAARAERVLDQKQLATKKQQHVLYGEMPEEEVHSEGHGVQLLLTDAMGVNRDISIFAGLTRQTENLMYRLQDPALDTLVLAPTNGVMQNLPRKPWEDAPDADPISPNAGPHGDERRALENIEKFVLSHVVFGYSFQQPGHKSKCGSGLSDLWYEIAGDKVTVHSDKKAANVVKMERVGNGQVWTIDDVLN